MAISCVRRSNRGLPSGPFPVSSIQETVRLPIQEAEISDAVAPLAPFPVHKLIEAFDRVMRQAKLKVAHDVVIDRLTLSQKIAELTDRLETEARFTFTSMFSFLRDGKPRALAEVKHECVVTFLALLEMAKLRLIAITQPEGAEDIMIERASDDLRARVEATVAGSDEYR